MSEGTSFSQRVFSALPKISPPVPIKSQNQIISFSVDTQCMVEATPTTPNEELLKAFDMSCSFVAKKIVRIGPSHALRDGSWSKGVGVARQFIRALYIRSRFNMKMHRSMI